MRVRASVGPSLRVTRGWRRSVGARVGVTHCWAGVRSPGGRRCGREGSCTPGREAGFAFGRFGCEEFSC